MANENDVEAQALTDEEPDYCVEKERTQPFSWACLKAEFLWYAQ